MYLLLFGQLRSGEVHLVMSDLLFLQAFVFFRELK